MQCPRCSARTIIKNGITSSSGKQNYRCKACGRQFVENPTQGCISEEKKRLVNRLLLEKIPLAGIARTVQVSVRWLQYYGVRLNYNVAILRPVRRTAVSYPKIAPSARVSSPTRANSSPLSCLYPSNASPTHRSAV